MSTVKHQIEVQERSEFGKNAARRARAAGMIPANVYSKGKANRSLLIKEGDWTSLTQHAVNLVHLINGKEDTAALIKEVQFNYLKNYVVHIDFQEVSLDQEIHAQITVHAKGESVGAAHGGVLEQELHEITVCCKPQYLPELLYADVTALEIGQALHLKDLVLPENVAAVGDPDSVVFRVSEPQQEVAEEPAAEGAAEPEVIKSKPAAEDEEADKEKK